MASANRAKFACVSFAFILRYADKTIRGLVRGNTPYFIIPYYQMSKKSKAKQDVHTASPKEIVGPVTEKSGVITISVLARPGAKQDCITSFETEGVGIQIAAPPVDGEANTQLVKYLSKVLGLRKSDVSIDKGSRSRNKQIHVTGLSKEEVISILKTEVNS